MPFFSAEEKVTSWPSPAPTWTYMRSGRVSGKAKQWVGYFGTSPTLNCLLVSPTSVQHEGCQKTRKSGTTHTDAIHTTHTHKLTAISHFTEAYPKTCIGDSDKGFSFGE